MMNVRDAVEDDVGALASMAHAPKDVMENVIHDRTVRIAEREPGDDSSADEESETDGEESDANGEESETDSGDGEASEMRENDVLGFVSFDAGRHAVHVTHLGGTEQSLRRLLDEPVRFARKEGMPVEMVVPESETEHRTVAEGLGFVEAGDGPRFEGAPTVKYRLDE